MVGVTARSLLSIALLIFALSMASAQVSVDRQVPAGIVADEGFTITLTVTVTVTGTFDIAELVPEGWQITNWGASGNSSRVRFEVLSVPYRGEQKSAYHWKFDEPVGKQVVLSYTIRPSSGYSGFQTLTYVYTFPGGFTANDYTLFISPSAFPIAVCGNNVCELGETGTGCPSDCAGQVITATNMLILLIVAGAVATVIYLVIQRVPRPALPARYAEPGAEEIALEAVMLPAERVRAARRRPKRYRAKGFVAETIARFEQLKKRLK
jgi:hypothetical protein